MEDVKQEIVEAVANLVYELAGELSTERGREQARQALVLTLTKFEQDIMRKCGVAIREYGE